MKKKGLFKLIIIVAILMIVIAGSVARFNAVNNRFPDVKIEDYYLNESFSYNGFDITASDFKLLDFSELSTDVLKYDDTIENAEGKQALVTLKLVNNNKEEQRIDFLGNIKINAYDNAFDLNMLGYYNEEPTLTLEPGQELTITLPYIMFKDNFSEKTWSNFEDNDIQIVCTLYPIKRIIHLN